MANINIQIKRLAFSLIELMVVIAIIAILASVAIPSYRNYVIKSRMTEALTLMNSTKNKISEYYDLHGALPANDGIDDFPLVNPTATISAVNWDKNEQAIKATFNSEISADLNGKVLEMVVVIENDIFKWTCRSSQDASKAIPLNYLPGSCVTN